MYTVSSINITSGVWSIFGQISYKVASITGSIPLFFYNGFDVMAVPFVIIVAIT